MAAPVVEATATTSEGAAGTSHTVNLPSGITAGNLLVLAISGVQTSPVTTPSGWTLHSDANLYDPGFHNLARIYWRIADGNEGSTLSMTSSADAAFGAVCYRISGATATDPLTALTYAKSNPWDGYPNPPLSSIDLQRDWLFVAGVIDYSAAQLMTGAPTGYSTMSTGVGEHNTGFHSRVTLCYKSTAVVASDNPGTFTAAAPTYWCAFTFAITPARTDSPVVEATAGTNESGSSTSHAINLPSGIVAGDLLLMAIAFRASYSLTTPSGWTSVYTAVAEYSGQNKLWLYYRSADGTEGATVTVTSDLAWSVGAVTCRISGAATSTGSITVNYTASPSNAPDSASLSVSPSKNWLYVSGWWTGSTDFWGFSIPSGYYAGHMARGTYGSFWSPVGLGAKGTVATTSEDPGAGWLAASAYWAAFTLAIAPMYRISGAGAIASAEAFGTVELVYNRELIGVGGIASAEAFGLVQVNAIKGATVPAISALAGTHAFSVAVWAKWTARTAGRVFSAWDASGNELVSIRVDNTASSANRAAHSVAGAANDGYYHLYVMTYDGVTLRFYIDGRAAGAEVASATSLAAAGGMRAGSGYQGATPFGGSVDDVAVFDYYLSASQVAGLYVSGTTSGVDLVHDSSGSSMVLAGWQPHAYMAGYAAVDTYSTAKDLTANGGCIAIPIALEGKMALRQVSLWNTDAATARSWNWSLYYQPRQDAISNTLFRVAAGVAADAFTPGAASKRSIAAAGAPTLLGPGSYWLVIQNNHATSTFGLGSIASGPLSINRAQTKTLTVPIGAQLDFTLATWTKVTAIYAVILEGDVLGLWGAY